MSTATDTTVVDTTNTADTTHQTQQTSTAEPYYKDWYNPSDGAINHKALERLPDHLKGVAPLLQNTKTIDDVLMRYQQANTLASKKALAPLVGNEPKEVIAERKALMDAMNGVPKEAKDYGITRPNEIPEHQWNPKLADGFSTWAHKNSVPPSAVKELLALQLGTVKEQLAAQANGEQQFWAGEQKKFEAALQTESIPVERASALVEKGAAAFGLKMDDPQTKIFLQGSMARLMCMRYAIATGEDKAIDGSGGDGKQGADSKAQADDIRSNPANPLNGPYWNEGGKFSRAAHDAAVEKHTELMRLHHSKTPVIDRRRRT
jgi:hypothetical protein